MKSKFNPQHYRNGAIEPWDFVISQNLGFLEGNIVKYITRAGKKDTESKIDDLLKAKAYLTKLIATCYDDDSGSPRTSHSIPTHNGVPYGDILTYFDEYADDPDCRRV